MVMPHDNTGSRGAAEKFSGKAAIREGRTGRVVKPALCEDIPFRKSGTTNGSSRCHSEKPRDEESGAVGLATDALALKVKPPVLVHGYLWRRVRPSAIYPFWLGIDCCPWELFLPSSGQSTATLTSFRLLTAHASAAKLPSSEWEDNPRHQPATRRIPVPTPSHQGDTGGI